MKTNFREVPDLLIFRIVSPPVKMLVLAAAWLLLAMNTVTAGTLTLTFATNVISEAAGPRATTATVQLDAPLTHSVVLLLRGTVDATKIYLPAALPTIPAGATNVTFSVDSVNNGDIDGDKTVTLTIGADLFANTSASLLVTDDDTAAHRTIGGRLIGTIAGTNDYYAVDNLTIPLGQTLTILPSSHLFFGATNGVTCNGSLIASGSQGSEVVFTRSPFNTNWNGISVVNTTNTSILNHVEIAYANTNGGITLTANTSASPLVVSNSAIHDCGGNGVTVTSWYNIHIFPLTVQIVSNRIFANAGSGVLLASFAAGCGNSYNSATVTGNEIYDNKHSGVFLDPSVYSSGCTAGPYYSQVDGKVDSNYIHGNGGDGITCLADTGSGGGANHVRKIASLIQNNLILNNGANGISLTGATAQSLQPKIINNTIAGNGNAGIYHVISSVAFTFENNLLLLNNYGIQSQTLFPATNVIVAHNGVWGNYISNWMNYPVTYGTVATTNLNGTGADTNLNISVDPLVVSGFDFHLQPGSPAVDAGTTNLAPTQDIAGVSRRGFPDIGAYEFGSLLLTAASPTNQGVFNLLASGGRGTPFTIETSTDLKTWVTATNAALTNRTLWLPMPATNVNQIFYRAHIQ